MNFFNRMNKVIKNAPDSFAPGDRYLKEPGLSNPSQTSNQDVYIYDAQSWLPELHPNGRESSSYIEDVEFTNGTLVVKFRNGFKAQYDNVDPQIARDFVSAPSKGRYFHEHIRKLPYKQI